MNGRQHARLRRRSASRHNFHTHAMDNRIDTSDGPSDDAAAVIGSLRKKIALLEQDSRALALREHRFELMIEHAADFILVMNEDGVIEYCSPSWERVTEYSLHEILGKHTRDFLHPDDVPRVFRSIAMFLRSPGAIVHREFRCRRKDGTFGSFEGSLVNLLADPGVCGVVLNARDISERKRMEEHFKRSLKEKETMLKEIHHRVKNNLQLISSMLGLQAHHIQDEQISKIFRESKNRVKSMALIHEKLYQSKSLTDINFADYITTLIRYLFSSYGVHPAVIRFVPSFADITVDIDTMIHIGLLINELVSNSLKYAFPDGAAGEIGVAVARPDRGNTLVLRISDTGVGLPDDIDFRDTPTLGLQLVNLLTTQLNGTIAYERGKGTTFIITIPTMKH
jgi:PAS domain S-box-containing protein